MTNTYTITYEDGDIDEDVHFDLLLLVSPQPAQGSNILKGLLLRTTDPRFLTDGDIILTPTELRRFSWNTRNTSQTKKYGPPQQKPAPPSKKKMKKYITNEINGKENKQPDSSTQPSPT
jgi:hypothetical protein